jgi:hypothetical protein
MVDSYTFAVAVVRAIGDRLATKAVELGLLVEENTSFAEWFKSEAFLACKLQQASYPFCEVTAKPTYASEGVADEGSLSRDAGDLRVGGPGDGANHCWAFIEFAFHHDENHTDEESRTLAAAIDRLKRLGWKKSAALLFVVAARKSNLLSERPTLTAPFVIALPNGGTVVLKAFDIKRDPSDTLTKAHVEN